MKCKRCGFLTPDNSNFCSHCGTKIDFDDTFINAEQAYQDVYSQNKSGKKSNKYREEDLRVSTGKASFLWYVLGFIVPIVGYLLAYIFSYDKPDLARKSRIGALWGTITYLVVYLSSFIFCFIL